MIRIDSAKKTYIESSGQFSALLGKATEKAFELASGRSKKRLSDLLQERGIQIDRIEVYKTIRPIKIWSKGKLLFEARQGAYFIPQDFPNDTDATIYYQEAKEVRTCPECKEIFEPHKRTCLKCGYKGKARDVKVWSVYSYEKDLFFYQHSRPLFYILTKDVLGKKLIEKIDVSRREIDAIEIYDGRVVCTEIKATSMEKITPSKFAQAVFYPLLIRMLHRQSGMLEDIDTSLVEVVLYTVSEANISDYSDLEQQHDVTIKLTYLEAWCQSVGLSKIIISYGRDGYEYVPEYGPESFAVFVDSVNDDTMKIWQGPHEAVNHQNKADQRVLAFQSEVI